MEIYVHQSTLCNVNTLIAIVFSDVSNTEIRVYEYVIYVYKCISLNDNALFSDTWILCTQIAIIVLRWYVLKRDICVVH